ncbi:DUF3408 domain-containing protein [Moheibacter lacus]|uniref:DUF3408 domain-containing protein n=1 Tax=Moheibacter lacus TaxID=2745851 RepID=A0A838ZTP3_9FLAO|nr:DUF3408 domain-containing protein [Moheibacter lacus]MBA5630358.1 DUF3408 domain-containing protein [Moheibacter lacus]
MKEKQKERKKIPDLSEELMMDLMVEGIKKEGMELTEFYTNNPEAIDKEKKRNPKKKQNNNYEELFFKKSETSARNGKTVYIRPEFHDRLNRIVQVIGEDKTSIYAYLDNLLEYHFEEFGDQIVKSYNEKYKPIL